MNIFSLLSFASFIIYLILGFYVLRLDSNNRLHRTFSLMTLSLALWAFAYTFIYPAVDQDTAYRWLFVASFGVFYIPGILLKFVVDLTYPTPATRHRWLYFIYYLPGLLMHIKYFVDGEVTVIGLSPGPLGWIEQVDPDSFWFLYLNVYFFSYIIISVARVWRWGKSSLRRHQKKQAWLISLSILITLSASLVTDTLLPALSIPVIPSIAPIFFLILAYGLWLAISRHRLMILTPEIAADEIISRIHELLFLVNSQGQIIMANSKVYQLLGYTSLEMRGDYIASYIDMHGFNHSLIRENLLVAEKLVIDEVCFVSRSGEKIPVELSCSPIKDQAREVIGMVMVGQDLRMLYQLQALQKEKEYQELKTRFITTASHEFRTPLASIQLSAETLQNHYHQMDQSRREEYFSLIFQSISRMDNLLSDVLTLEKMSHQKIQPDYQNLTLRPFLEDIIRMEALQTQGQDTLQFQFELPEDVQYISDPKLLHNILFNLIGNSLKYSSPGIPVRLEVRREKQQLCLQVIDQGIGISKTDLPRIFDSFHRGKNIGNISGTGLGLSIVKNSVELLGGEISLQSREGKGTRVKVCLPWLKKLPWDTSI